MATEETMSPSERPNEGSLAVRLLAALGEGRDADARVLQGQLLGLHMAKVRIFVNRAAPAAVSEEIFLNSMEKAVKALQRPTTARWLVETGGSLSGLLFTIAGAEVKQFLRGRPPYKDDIKAIHDDELARGAADKRGEVDKPGAVADLSEYSARRHDVDLILEAAGGITSFDAVLLVLHDGLGFGFAEIESLLRIDLGAADADARVAEALDVDLQLSGLVVALVRGCGPVGPRSEGALKVAAHRARGRVRQNIDPADLQSDDT